MSHPCLDQTQHISDPLPYFRSYFLYFDRAVNIKSEDIALLKKCQVGTLRIL